MPSQNRNFKRSQPSSNTEDSLGLALARVAEALGELETVATRGLPAGYRFEVDDVGPMIVDVFNDRYARMEWTEND